MRTCLPAAAEPLQGMGRTLIAAVSTELQVSDLPVWTFVHLVELFIAGAAVEAAGGFRGSAQHPDDHGAVPASACKLCSALLAGICQTWMLVYLRQLCCALFDG